MDIIILTLTFLSSWMLSVMGEYLFSGALLIGLSLYLFAVYYERSGRLLLCPAGLFSLSWIGGAGLSALKLSNLQTDWEAETWIAIWLFAAAFLGIYGLLFKALSRKMASGPEEKEIGIKEPEPEAEETGTKGTGISEAGDTLTDGLSSEARFTAIAIFITSFVSVAAFLTEVYILGYIPLFTVDTPHAYSYFHVSGLHYFTTAFVLIPAEAVTYFKLRKRLDKSRMDIMVLICTAVALLLPILLVSRFQLILSIALSVFSLLLMRRDSIGSLFDKKRLPVISALFIAMIGLYVFLTIERAHSIEYLKGIFDMKQDSLPIWLIQPYMYVANNFDNLNCLIRDLAVHSGGLRMLFPVLVFTGLKFQRPELVSFPIYTTKEELTTLTIAYDAYYDFGLLGVAVFGMVLGALMAFLELRFADRRERKGLLFGYVLAAQPFFYISLSFFTTWYSNPSTWFYFGVSAMVYAFIRLCMRFFDRR